MLRCQKVHAHIGLTKPHIDALAWAWMVGVWLNFNVLYSWMLVNLYKVSSKADEQIAWRTQKGAIRLQERQPSPMIIIVPHHHACRTPNASHQFIDTTLSIDYVTVVAWNLSSAFITVASNSHHKAP